MADGSITLSEGMGWMKTLRERHAELVSLRNANAFKETRMYGQDVNKMIEKDPIYDVKKLDSMVSRLAREMRLLDEAIKKTNSLTPVAGYVRNEGVLGELELV